jgi:hypothetical protein
MGGLLADQNKRDWPSPNNICFDHAFPSRRVSGEFYRIVADCISMRRNSGSSTDSGRPSLQVTLNLCGFCQLEHRWTQMKHGLPQRRRGAEKKFQI